MSFTTVAFFVFLLAGIVVYYVLPKNVQWIWLLILSYIYYFTFSIKASLFMVFATVTIYFGGIWLQNIQNTGDRYLKDNKETLSREDKKAYKESLRRKKRWVLFLILLLDFGMLAVVKYSNFAIENINSVLGLIGKEPIGLLGMGLPLGISFFTFQSVSYAIDVYQGKYECEKNIFKMGLFVSFFPQLLQGPIGRYDRLGKQLYSGHSFNLKNVEYGLQRIGWGLFKKVVIADRAAVLVLNVFNNYEAYSGFHYIMAVLMYSVDLYMDFSGGIDIVIGAAQMFGITMDENFRQPYFSKSIGEFWRRWHITLGAWLKAYVFYPVSVSGLVKKWNHFARKHVGKYLTKMGIFAMTLFPVWMCNGLWHGAQWNYILYGMYYFVILLAGEAVAPVREMVLERFHLDCHALYWRVPQILKTWMIIFTGEMFFRAEGAAAGFHMFRSIFQGFELQKLWDGTLLGMGLNAADFAAVGFGILIVAVADILKERKLLNWDKLQEMKLPVRWILYYGLIFAVLLLGAYGTGYQQVDLIYAGF